MALILQLKCAPLLLVTSRVPFLTIRHNAVSFVMFSIHQTSMIFRHTSLMDFGKYACIEKFTFEEMHISTPVSSLKCFVLWVQVALQSGLGARTLSPSATHYSVSMESLSSGPIEYNVHNMYGLMESRATRFELSHFCIRNGEEDERESLIVEGVTFEIYTDHLRWMKSGIAHFGPFIPPFHSLTFYLPLFRFGTS